MSRTLKRSFRLIAFLCVVSFALPPTAHAQSLEPRLYSNIPTRLNFLVLGYGFTQGDILVDPALPINRRHSIKLYGSTGLYTRTGTKFDVLGAAWQFRWGGGV